MSVTPKAPVKDDLKQTTASSASRALNLLGDRWTLMICSQAFVGVTRFEDFQSRIGIARSLLTERLRRLENGGVLARHRYLERPPRDEYRLTDRGEDLFNTALMILRWEGLWHHDPKLRAHNLTHSCGHRLVPQCRCSHCDTEVLARDVNALLGPGAGFDLAPKARAQRRSTVEVRNNTEAMLERTIEVLGDRWVAHTIAAAFNGCHRFGEFQQEMGIATNILSERLARLVTLGVFEQRPYQTQPVRMEYRLTQKGLDLFPLVVTLVEWGQKWLSGPEGPPEILMHNCGQPLHARIVCAHCKTVVSRESLSGLHATPQ